MNREDIIRLAQSAGIGWGLGIGGMEDFLERFAALVATAELEACAKVCEAEAEKQYDNMDIPLTIAADLIRARGETLSRGQA